MCNVFARMQPHVKLSIIQYIKMIIRLLVLFFVDFFSCENKSLQKKGATYITYVCQSMLI